MFDAFRGWKSPTLSKGKNLSSFGCQVADLNVKSSWNAWNALCDAMRVCKEQLVSVLRSLIFFHP